MSYNKLIFPGTFWISSVQTTTKVCSESLDTKFRNCDNSEDLSAILNFFLEIVGIVKKHIFYVSKSENVQEFALKSQK